MGLLQNLRPDWWFSAHLHVRFEAVVKHGGPGEGDPPVPAANPEEIVISDEDVDEGNVTTEATSMNEVRDTTPRNPDEIAQGSGEDTIRSVVPQSETRFIALDKCLPHRAFLEVFFSWSSSLQ